MKNRTTIIVAAGCLLAAPAIATASVITHDLLAAGQNEVLLSIGDVSTNVQAQGGNFQTKTVAGFTAAGISGGSVNGEIDGSQSMDFSFDKPIHITSLTVAFLYAAGNHGDLWNEIALFTTDLGSFTLEATGATSSIWTGSGAAFNVSPGVEGGGGAWTIAGDDIFGGAITSLVLSSGNPGSHAKYGDFSFAGMTYTVVPTPGSLALLLGAIGVGCTRRRK